MRRLSAGALLKTPGRGSVANVYLASAINKAARPKRERQPAAVWRTH